jgi:coproporphyrinogen III oxidase-like Fe-S oxidoreductase
MVFIDLHLKCYFCVCSNKVTTKRQPEELNYCMEIVKVIDIISCKPDSKPVIFGGGIKRELKQ